jgi:hypothetical protein
MRGTLVVLALALAVGCGGKQVPQHTGYKGKKPTPWTKAKPIELDEEYKAKVSGELDYGEFKRAKWYSLTLPGPGSVDFNFEFVPGTDEDMDVAFEVLDPNNKVLVRADAESEDVNEQKKQRKLEDLPEGRYLIHVYLQGRLDTADFDLKLQFARGTAVWKSDFPNQVPYPDELPAVPPFDDTPSSAPPPRCGVPGKPKCPKRCGTPGAQPCRPPPPQETCGVPGKPAVHAAADLGVDHQRRSGSVGRAHHGRRGHRRRRAERHEGLRQGREGRELHARQLHRDAVYGDGEGGGRRCAQLRRSRYQAAVARRACDARNAARGVIGTARWAVRTSAIAG